MARSRNEKVNIIVGAKDKTKGILGNIQRQVIGIGAAYLGFRAVTGILGDIVEKGKEHEKAWNDVAASLKRHGFEIDSNLDKIKKFSDEMQSMTGRSDELIGKGVQGFIDYGQTIDQAMDTMEVALDFAAGADMELSSALDLLQKAGVGYTSTLSRYGIIIDENIPKSEKFAAAIDQINQRFGGAAQAQAETFAVKMELVGQMIGDLEEKLFKLFAPALLSGLKVAIGVLDEMMGTIDFLFPPTEKLQGAFYDLEGNLTEAGKAAGYTKDQFSDLTEQERLLIEETQGVTKSLVEWAAGTEAVKQMEQISKAFEEGMDVPIEQIKLLKVTWEGFSGIAPDATNVIIGGLDQMAIALNGAAVETSLTREELEGLLNVPPEHLENIQESIATTGEVWNAFGEEYSHGWQVTRDDMEEMDAEYAVSIVGVNNRIQKGFVKLQKHTAKGHEETIRQMTIAEEAFANASYGAMSNAVDNIVGSLSFLRTESTGVFKNMATDFGRYFIADLLKQMAGKLVPKMLGILGSIFDTRANDRIAMTQGRHFAQFFTRGMVDELGSAGLGNRLALAAPGAASSFPASGAAFMGGGDTYNISVIVEGPLLAEETWVDDVLVPKIVQGARSGKNDLQVDSNDLTGRSAFSF